MGNYELSKEELRKVQLIQLELLQEADRICKKCGIRYNIIAGTLLGAVRHGGYIPWDDDADVALLRPEYEKFRKACKKELNHEKYYFQDHRATGGYRWGYGKLRRKGTIFLRKNQEHMPYEQGVFIDIFPLDGVPDNYFLRSLHNFECFCVRKTLWARVGKIADPNPMMRGWYRLLDRIPEQRIFSYYHKLIRRSNRIGGRMVRILTFPTPNSEYGYYRCWYQSSAPIEFEGITFEGIRDYDSYLSFKFGNYMELPPESQRKVHPVSQLKLEIE